MENTVASVGRANGSGACYDPAYVPSHTSHVHSPTSSFLAVPSQSACPSPSSGAALTHGVIQTVFNKVVIDLRYQRVCYFDMQSLINFSVVNKFTKEKNILSCLLRSLTNDKKILEEIAKLTPEDAKKICEEIVDGKISLPHNDNEFHFFRLILSAARHKHDNLIELLTNSGAIEEGYVLLVERLVQREKVCSSIADLSFNRQEKLSLEIRALVDCVNLEDLFAEQAVGGATDHDVLLRLAKNNKCKVMKQILTVSSSESNQLRLIRRRRDRNNELFLGLGMLATAFLAALSAIVVLAAKTR